MVKKILSILAWMVTGAALVVLFIFARKDYLDTPIHSYNIKVDRASNQGFVKEEAVVEDLSNLCAMATIGSANMVSINKQLKSNPWIESSSSYIDLNANLNVNIKEYQPVLRVFGNKGTSAYVTAEKTVLPTSVGYTPHVLIASGNFDLDSELLNRQLSDTLKADWNILNALHILKAIQRNEFMGSCIGQIYCNGRNEFEIVARDIDAKILVGDTCNIDDKLKRLEIFIKQKTNSLEIKGYKTIDLKYKNQIVCTKR